MKNNAKTGRVLFLGIFLKVFMLICLALPVSAQEEPSVEIRGGAEFSETLTYVAVVKNAPGDLVYQWSVSEGEIIRGQGTSVISVTNVRQDYFSREIEVALTVSWNEGKNSRKTVLPVTVPGIGHG